jgi:hypothetical protein
MVEPVARRADSLRPITLAAKGHSLRKKSIPFGTNARVRRVHGDA